MPAIAFLEYPTFELLDVARRILNGGLPDAVDMLRLVEAEPGSRDRSP